MGLLGYFKKRANDKRQHADNMAIIRARMNRRQEDVFQAVRQLNRPVNGMAIARSMNVDSASVTPRLAELVKKGQLKVAYVNKGLDGIRRRFYVVNTNN